MSPERLARVALNVLFEPADARVNELLSRMPAVEALRQLTDPDQTELRLEIGARLPGLDPREILDRAQASGARFVIPGDDEWPQQADDLAEAPAVGGDEGRPVGLWVRGPLRLDQLQTSVAIVGSRSVTSYGEAVASQIAAEVALDGVVVVSGGAYGIDAAAHMGALAVRRPTVAVLACGIDRFYPRGNSALLERVASTGAIVAESPPGSAPMKHRFLTRNRVIAGLSAGTVVVEAAIRSGALNTANWTDGLSRPVMAVPGPVTSAQSEGTHELLRRGAGLVACGAHVQELLAPHGSGLVAEPRATPSSRDQLSKNARRILDAAPIVRPASVGSIARVAGLPEAEVVEVLEALLREGLVTQQERGWVQGCATTEPAETSASTPVTRVV